MLKSTKFTIISVLLILTLSFFVGCSDEDEDDEQQPIEGELLVQHVLLDEPYAKDFSEVDPVEIDGETLLPVADFISITELNAQLEDRSGIEATEDDYRYRIYGSDGFYAYDKRYSRGAQDNTWEHLQHCYIRPGDNQILFDYTTAEEEENNIVGAHKVKDAEKIRYMRERFTICDTSHTVIGEFHFSDHDTTLNVTFQDSLDAYKLTDMVTNCSNWDKTPENYGYELVASDGWTGFKVYSWDRLEQGYWVWENQKTQFEVVSTGKNEMKDLMKIRLRPTSEINEDIQ